MTFSYHYHVLVSSNWNGEQWYLGPVGSNGNYNGTVDYHGINVSTFRQKIQPLMDAENAQKWAIKWGPRITSIIKYVSDIGRCFLYKFNFPVEERIGK